ncbi:hypothetical protein MN116_001909 [Schistosoma mekongi]|uniref:C2H2-type domain-containing protein n=1 Tax=Schistosoma mekongi TaxID=38744 RepID=A0AAE2D989_SCHME|nr:hypothetical protein MN116_001909 [Schistosoma mekongi]
MLPSVNSSEQMTESHHITQKSSSPLSPTKKFEKQINTPLSSSSSSTSSCPSVSSTTSPQSIGLGINLTKSFITHINEHPLSETFKSKTNRVLQDGITDGVQETTTLDSNQHIFSNFQSVCFSMPNESLLNQIANSYGTNFFPIPTSFSPNDLCINKFPDSLARSWTEGCSATNLTFNTDTTNSINSTVNISRNNCINHMISGIDADNMFLRSHFSGLSSRNINESKNLISAPYDNLTPPGIMSNFHSIDKLKLAIPESENHANNIFSDFNSYTDLTKSRNSTSTAINAFNNNSSSGNSRKTDEDFCDLCQKHFCNKYYLRKHKTDVHGIHTEPYSHSRRRASETQSVNNSNQIKNGNLSLVNNNSISAAITTDFVHNVSSDIDNTLKINNPMFHSDSSKIKDKLKGIDFSMDFGKSQLTDLHYDLIKTQSPTKWESSNKSLSNIYDYINSGSNALLPSYVSEITNGKLYGNDEGSQWNKNFVSTTNTSISGVNNPISSNKCSDNVDELINISESKGILNETKDTYHIPTYDVTTSCNHNDMSKDERQKSMIDSLRIQSNRLNPLLSAQHYYMMALAANFSSATNSLFSPSEMLAKSNFMQTFNTPLDIPFLSVPPTPDLNNIALQEAQCDQCQKVFCNEYFLQLHNLSHQNNLHKSTLRNEKEQLNILDNVSTEIEDKLNNKNSNTDKSDMDIDANDNSDCDSQRNNQVKTKKEETDSSLFLLNKSNNSEMNVNYLENSELRLGTHSLDAFKSSMVAAKLADRVTCELCNKELCNKYFLRTHKIRVHGISPKEVGGPPMRNPPTIENSTLSCNLNDLQATNCITNSHATNSMLNFDENGKMETVLSGDMLNSFNSAYSTLGLVNQFLPLAYWPFFASGNFIPEQAVNYPLDKSILSNLDNVATWNNLNSSITYDIYSHTSPTINNNNSKNPDLAEIPCAITSICCPLCDLPIGPRLFLPTHLSSVHKLSPTDPDFFMNMLRAKPLSKTEKVTDIKSFDYWSSIHPKSINVGFQEECTINNINQPDIADLANGCISSCDKNGEQINVNNCSDNLILKGLKSFSQKMELKANSNESTSIASDIMNIKSLDIELQAQTMKFQPVSSSNELSSNDITDYLSTNTSSMNSISFLPVNQVNTVETTINDSHTAKLCRVPVTSTVCSGDGVTTYASSTTTSFSSLPINPIASMTEVAATGDSVSSRSWNMMTHLSINNHSNNQSTMNQLTEEVSPTSSVGNISNSIAQSSIPRKSPNQMRVLCDICNKWICNKYFLRTHKANKHGVTDLSLGSLENHRSGIEKSVTSMKSNIHTSFRRAMNHCVRGSSQGEDKVINNYPNSNRKLNSPCDSQISYRNSCITSKQERQIHNTEQLIISNDFLTGTSLTNISATTDISGTINSFPLTFPTTVATHLPWLSCGFSHQPTSLVSYPTMNYPSILSFPMLLNSDIYPYPQIDVVEKLETTESNVRNSESNKISTDTESENEENKNPLNLSLKITLEDQKSTCYFTTSNTPISSTSIVNDNDDNNNNTSTTNKSNKPLEINMMNNKTTWLKQGQIIKNYSKNQYSSSFCNQHAYNRLHRKSNQFLLSLQLKRKSVQFIRRKICLKKKNDVDKHIEETEDSQINIPATTCETQKNNMKNITTSSQYSLNRFRKTRNYHYRLNRLQQKKHRKKKIAESYYLTTETLSKQFYSQTTHKRISNACNLYNEIQLDKRNPPMNDENCPTEIIKSKFIFPTKISCPLCLDGNVFIEYIEFIRHLKEIHSILEYEPVMKLLKAQMEFHNPHSYIFQTNNSITTSKPIKPDTYDCNFHVSSVNNVAATVSLAIEGSNTVISNSDFSNVPTSHNDIMYDFQEDNNLNSSSSKKSIDLTSTVVCQSSLVLLPSTSCSSSTSSTLLQQSSPSSSILVTNSMVSSPRTLGRPLFMPINSFTKTLSTM